MLTLIRNGKYGKLYVRGIFFCYTIDTMKLPDGHYEVEVGYSPKFKCNLPLVYNDTTILPSRGFRIHSGNTIKDTDGCILVGNTLTVDSKNTVVLANSRATLNELMKKIPNNRTNLTVITT